MSGFPVAKIGHQLFVGQRREARGLAGRIERGVAADHNEPRRCVARRSIHWPVLQRAQAGFLEGFFSGVEIAEVAKKRGHGLGTRGRDGRFDPGKISHSAAPAFEGSA